MALHQLGHDSEICFYEATGVQQQPEGRVRVWAKCLPQKDLDAVDIQKDFSGRILENTADRVAHYYVPPIATIESADVEQMMSIAQYEQTADIANIQPRARIFYEINCSERMIRELSIFIQVGGKVGSHAVTLYGGPALATRRPIALVFAVRAACHADARSVRPV